MSCSFCTRPSLGWAWAKTGGESHQIRVCSFHLGVAKTMLWGYDRPAPLRFGEAAANGLDSTTQQSRRN